MFVLSELILQVNELCLITVKYTSNLAFAIYEQKNILHYYIMPELWIVVSGGHIPLFFQEIALPGMKLPKGLVFKLSFLKINLIKVLR